MNQTIANELLRRLADSPVVIEPTTEAILRYSEFDNFALSVSSTDILSLFEVGPLPRPIASFRMLDSEYSLQDALCLAYHRIPGKDILEYLGN
jgi:hypothetical protein